LQTHHWQAWAPQMVNWMPPMRFVPVLRTATRRRMPSQPNKSALALSTKWSRPPYCAVYQCDTQREERGLLTHAWTASHGPFLQVRQRRDAWFECLGAIDRGKMEDETGVRMDAFFLLYYCMMPVSASNTRHIGHRA
jgi:hypothetical protein